jgi:hypothetical protein
MESPLRDPVLSVKGDRLSYLLLPLLRRTTSVLQMNTEAVEPHITDCLQYSVLEVRPLSLQALFCTSFASHDVPVVMLDFVLVDA